MQTNQKGTAVLEDGQTISYLTTPIGEGATKEVYPTADRSGVICFYKDAALGRDFEWLARLRAVIADYNPTAASPGAAASARAEADYYNDLFRWPTAVVKAPRFGFLAPTIGTRFIFRSGPLHLRGKEKSFSWFTMPRARRMIAQEAPKLLGDLRRDLTACRALARAAMRLHQAGLAHADLSPNNVLVDPESGGVCLIDLDGLAVPGRFPSPVLGTGGYIPPEVVAQLGPCTPSGAILGNPVHGDQHALAVLIYQLLLHRHPLDGRRVPAAATAEEQDRLMYGQEALFCEHPADGRNRPTEDDYVPVTALGPDLTGLFRRSFVTGLHDPQSRPTALEWLDALNKAEDMLRPCGDSYCPRRWFVASGPGRRCPYCGTDAAGPAQALTLLDEANGRRWVARRVVLYGGLTLHRWHVESAVKQGPSVDARPLARIQASGERFRLVNLGPGEMRRPDGSDILVNGSVTLKEGMEVRLSVAPRGRIARVEPF